MQRLLIATGGDGGVIPPGREPIEEWAVVAAGMGAQCARYGVCGDCGRVVVAKIEAFRREFWARLPQFFELE